MPRFGFDERRRPISSRTSTGCVPSRRRAGCPSARPGRSRKGSSPWRRAAHPAARDAVRGAPPTGRATAVARRRRPRRRPVRGSRMSDRPASPVGPITARRERRGERKVLASFGVTMLTGFAAADPLRHGRPDAARRDPARAVPRRAGRGHRPVGAGADVGRAPHRGAAPARQRRGGGRRPSRMRSPTRRASAPAGTPGRAGRRARRARVGARDPRPVARPRAGQQPVPDAVEAGPSPGRRRGPGRPRGGYPAGRRASPCSPRASPATPRPRRCSSMPVPTGWSCRPEAAEVGA